MHVSFILPLGLCVDFVHEKLMQNIYLFHTTGLHEMLTFHTVMDESYA